MKYPFKSTIDPLIQAVIQDEEPMSLTVAADVRRRQQKRRKLRRNAIAAAMVMGMGVMLSFSLREAVRTGRSGLGRNPNPNQGLVSSNGGKAVTVAVTRI